MSKEYIIEQSAEYTKPIEQGWVMLTALSTKVQEENNVTSFYIPLPSNQTYKLVESIARYMGYGRSLSHVVTIDYKKTYEQDNIAKQNLSHLWVIEHYAIGMYLNMMALNDIIEEKGAF